jgi:hypothetical protein
MRQYAMNFELKLGRSRLILIESVLIGDTSRFVWFDDNCEDNTCIYNIDVMIEISDDLPLILQSLIFIVDFEWIF